jgi:hypothetical protein
MAVYFAVFQLYERRQSEEAVKEISQATSNLMRVVGWLFTLLLSLTFTDAVGESSLTEAAVEGEAAALASIDHNLRRFGSDESNKIRNLLIQYTREVIDHDWPTLAEGRLSDQTHATMRELEDAVLRMEATHAIQETLRTRLIADVDKVSAFRISRLQQAREAPSLVLIVVFIGYLITMVYFGIYKPRRVFVYLLSLYTVFVGIVVYMILALYTPFQGAASVDSAPLHLVLEAMRESQGTDHETVTEVAPENTPFKPRSGKS